MKSSSSEKFYKFNNTYILTLEPYAKEVPYKVIIRDLEYLGFKNVEIIHELSREGEVILRVPDTDFMTFSRYVRLLDYVSHIFELVYIIRDISLTDLLKKLSSEMLKELVNRYNIKTFRVTAKRICKEFPMTSIEVAREVGSELSKICRVDLEKPDCHVYVEIRRDIIIIGYALGDFARKVRECVPAEIISNIVVIVDNPQMIYEVMDLIQLSRALKLRMRIFDREKKAEALIEKACRKIGLDSVPDTVALCDNVSACLEGCDVVIVLSQYARFGERLLSEISREVLKRKRRLCLVLGNELQDPGIDLRERAHYEVRLGPCTGQAMRTVNALTYALGVIVASHIIGESMCKRCE